MPILLQDLRHAIRQVLQRPLFALTAVSTLAIGLGVNAVAFTVVNGLLYNGPATSVPDDAGRIATTPGGDESGYASLDEYRRFADATAGALDLQAEGRLSMALQHEGTTSTVWALLVSSRYFDVVRAQPIAGRIEVGRTGEGPAVVIGERFWRNTLQAPPLAGLTLRVNDTVVSVSGVLAESFTGPAGIYSPDVWLPLEDLDLFNTAAALHDRDRRWLFLLGRLQPAATPSQIQARIAAAAADMAREWPATHAGRGAQFRMLGEGNSELRGLSTAAGIAMSIIGLVLLLACFNVANLLLARSVERERDMAVRAAIGASTWRLVRLVVTEGFVLAIVAGAAALLVTWWTQSMVGSFAMPIEEPQHVNLTPDARVVMFVAALVVIAGVAPGVWPALAAARVDVVRVLGAQGGVAIGGRPAALRQWLVGAQVAGSTAFLALAALLTQSYGVLSETDMGFARDQLLVAEFDPSSHGYDLDRAARYSEDLMARIRALPGVADVALADRAPFWIGFSRVTRVAAGGGSCDDNRCPEHQTLRVGPGYFRTMGIALTAGREFQAGDAGSAVVINQPLARTLAARGSALGQVLHLGPEGKPATVVGITARTHTRGLDREVPTLYLPFALADYERQVALVTRTSVSAATLVRPIADVSQAMDSRVAMLSVKTMVQRMAVQLWPFRTVSWLFAICGALALVLAVIGLAGVVFHAVNRRRKEFGLRVSIGATRRDLVGHVLRDSGRLLVPGLAAGALLAAGVAKLLQVVFVGVNVLNPLTYLAVALLQAAVVAVACIAPAIRAARVDPLAALRAE